jgi:hypothetical protein
MRIQIAEGPSNTLFTDRVNYIIQMVDTVLPPVMPPGSTVDFVKIDEVVLTIDAASIGFAEIPNIYRNLKIILFGRGSHADVDVEVRARLNADSSANYGCEYLTGVGSSAGAAEGISWTYIWLGNLPAANAAAGVGGSIETLFPGYAGTAFHKTVQSVSTHRRGITTLLTYLRIIGGHWQSTAEINQVYLYPVFGNFLAGTVATLYGMK